MDKVIEFVTREGISLGINILAALAIFLIGSRIAKFLVGVARRLMQKSAVEETLIKFAGNLLRMLLLALVILAALDQLGVDTTSFAAILAAAGLAVGFALQDSLGNFASGVMLILFKPFQVDDYINAGGSAGVVEQIHVFNTVMRTGDNVQIIVPNSAITGGTITNFSAKETRRIDLEFGCGYGDDLRAVKQYLEETLAGDTRVLEDPEPVVAVSELGDSSVNFVVRPWVKSSDYWSTRWDLNETIKLGFDERGFNIPYPTQDLHVHNAAG